jgi:predicted nuclease of restriction endonuclease-like (RecB) superfamily
MSELQKIEFYQNIRSLIVEARRKTWAVANSVMVQTYWHIGRMIVEEEQGGSARAVYGENLIKLLSKQLTSDFGKGFELRNLQYMRAFYLNFQNVNAPRSLLSWTHYRLLLKVQNQAARDFYEKEAVECQWSTRQLERQINSFYFERLLSSQDKKPVVKEAETGATKFQPEDFIRDPYVWEWLGLEPGKAFLEKDLEGALVQHLQEFLLELGKGFSFVARQKRISLDGKHFYIDLVFYNYLLKCFVLADLKIGELTHQDIGQMDTYVRWFEHNMRVEGDNPTIGVILCSEKNEAIVKYSILEESRQLFASKYMLYLPTEEELARELEREITVIRQELSFENNPES